MPMNEGFLRCHSFCHSEKIRRDSDISREIYSHATTPAQPNFAAQKNFAPNAFMDALKGLMRRKTSESVPSDSRRQHIYRPPTATLHGRFRFRFDLRRAHREFARRTCGDDTPLRSDADLLLEQIVDRLRIGLAARRLHHLADEPADRFRVRFGVGDLVGVLGDDVVDDLFDR
jgi:hypothetical protein